jgi:hypothetical protein
MGHLRDTGVDGRINIKVYLKEIRFKAVNSIQLVQDSVQ